MNLHTSSSGVRWKQSAAEPWPSQSLLQKRSTMEEKKRGDDLQQQLKAAKSASETMKQEMADYQTKATRIPYSPKEKLINSLKEGVWHRRSRQSHGQQHGTGGDEARARLQREEYPKSYDPDTAN
ncbi:unnamed protein product [Ranitomeya imitator]|uniref:Uncharacterized protein n=1 Tax=Ranitomeya imitator TaxID=111125 RepID=A0ABN9M7T4_9NEOB|nr:unnamed protein product [Ranitomeya imitator]